MGDGRIPTGMVHCGLVTAGAVIDKLPFLNLCLSRREWDMEAVAMRMQDLVDRIMGGARL